MNTASYMIRVLLQGLAPPSYAQVQQMEQQITDLSQKSYPNRQPIKLQVRFIPENVIESQPINEDDIKLDTESINKVNHSKY